MRSPGCGPTLRSWPSARTASPRCTPSSSTCRRSRSSISGCRACRVSTSRARSRPLPRRLRHGVGRACDRRIRSGAVDYALKPIAPARLATTVARLRERLQSPPRDLQHLLNRLAQVPAKGYLNWVQATVGNKLRLITVDEILCFQADAKLHPRRHPRRRGADPQADQGARAGVEPPRTITTVIAFSNAFLVMISLWLNIFFQ